MAEAGGARGAIASDGAHSDTAVGVVTDVGEGGGQAGTAGGGGGGGVVEGEGEREGEADNEVGFDVFVSRMGVVFLSCVYLTFYGWIKTIAFFLEVVPLVSWCEGWMVADATPLLCVRSGSGRFSGYHALVLGSVCAELSGTNSFLQQGWLLIGSRVYL